ncbi:MAG: aldose 1-epimerase family protein [Coriobacteriaceae bacterium]|nr:aldose 1-epimerase family protein [Coriobacteriaceae bacterium]
MATITTISKGGVSAKVSSMGAELTSLALDGREYLWQADPAFWGKHAPVLFPIVGSLRNDEAMSEQGPCRMPRHGLARINEHSISEVAEDGSSVTFEFTSTPETREVYPYDFKLNMTYAITGEATLAQTFTVTNTGSVPMPFSVGGHPAFNVPAPGAEDEVFEDYVIEFTEPWTCEAPTIAEGGLLTFDNAWTAVDNSSELPITHELFANDAVMLTDVPGNTLTLRGTKSGRGVRMDFPGFDYIGIWSALGDAPFVALEPWTGHATLTSEDDVFEHKRGITILEPGATHECTISMTLL